MNDSEFLTLCPSLSFIGKHCNQFRSNACLKTIVIRMVNTSLGSRFDIESRITACFEVNRPFFLYQTINSQDNTFAIIPSRSRVRVNISLMIVVLSLTLQAVCTKKVSGVSPGL